MSILSFLFRKKSRPLMGSPAANDAVRRQLAAHGDDGAAPRHVVHYAYPMTGNDLAGREAMAGALAARGFKVSTAASRSGFILEQTRAVLADDFDALTAELSGWFAERGWEYDGWECAVETTQTRHSA